MQDQANFAMQAGQPGIAHPDPKERIYSGLIVNRAHRCRTGHSDVTAKVEDKRQLTTLCNAK